MKHKNKNDKRKKNHDILKILCFSIVAIYILSILILACLPGEQLPQDIPSNTSLYFHFIEYFVLTILLGVYLIIYTNYRPLITTFLIGTSLAIITEIIQIFVPGRCFGLDDIFANMAGLNISITLFFIIAEYVIFQFAKMEEF